VTHQPSPLVEVDDANFVAVHRLRQMTYAVPTVDRGVQDALSGLVS
jgi:hypothetical protein